MKMVRAGDVIVAARLDRMFRSPLDALGVLAELKDRMKLTFIALQSSGCIDASH
jgi:hypothetical protein